MTNIVNVGEKNLTIEDINAIAKGANVSLSENHEFQHRINSSREYLENLLSSDKQIYGVNTGFGDSCTVEVEKELLHQLPINLTRYHSCGMGELFNEKEARAIQSVRLASLVTGYSGVSMGLLESLSGQLNKGIYPRIPKEGSVGASGDLTPLAYLASSLIGEGQSFCKGAEFSTKELYELENIEPYVLKPKEALALMNGTAVMTALACIAFEKVERMALLCSRLTAMNVLAIKGNPSHYEEDLFLAKPHPGQVKAASDIAECLTNYRPSMDSLRLQDRYSLRCSPHIIGVLLDALPAYRSMIEIELNSANDNPLIFVEDEKVLHGGNFYGGHIAYVMDSLKTLIANIADLMDRQLALIVDPKFNNGLSANLSGATGREKAISHGLKAVQISASAWTAEALKLTMPASVFSRSTECHNQDKVSMGTIAARDCLRVIELTDQVIAANAMAAAQGLQLREKSGEISRQQWGSIIENLFDSIRKESAEIIEDRGLEMDLRRLVHQFNEGDI